MIPSVELARFGYLVLKTWDSGDCHEILLLYFSLGCSHDGTGTSVECPTSNQYIMTPWLAKFKDLSAYNINPWRFSRCSVEAMKTYISSLGRYLLNCIVSNRYTLICSPVRG